MTQNKKKLFSIQRPSRTIRETAIQDLKPSNFAIYIPTSLKSLNYPEYIDPKLACDDNTCGNSKF